MYRTLFFLSLLSNFKFPLSSAIQLRPALCVLYGFLDSLALDTYW